MSEIVESQRLRARMLERLLAHSIPLMSLARATLRHVDGWPKESIDEVLDGFPLLQQAATMQRELLVIFPSRVDQARLRREFPLVHRAAGLHRHYTTPKLARLHIRAIDVEVREEVSVAPVAKPRRVPPVVTKGAPTKGRKEIMARFEDRYPEIITFTRGQKAAIARELISWFPGDNKPKHDTVARWISNCVKHRAERFPDTD